MRKLFLFLSFVILLHFSARGQFILLKFNVNDCARCLAITDSIISSDQTVPTFIVFADYELEDRQEIIKQLGDTSGLKVPILFNDKLYEKLIKYPISGLYYFNNQDEMIYFKTIDQLQVSDMKVVDSIYKNDFKFKNKPLTHIIRQVDTGLYVYNWQTSALDVSHTTKNYRIKITPEIEKRILDTMKVYKPGFYDLSELHQKETGRKEQYYNFITNYYEAWYDDIFIPVSSSYLEYEGNDTSNLIQKIKNDDHQIFIANFMALLKFEKGELIDIYPCVESGSRVEGRSSNLVRRINDSTFLMYYSDYETIINGFSKDRQNFLLAEYVLRDGQLVFKKRLNVDVPKSYKDFELRTSDFSFVALDYPYLASFYGNVIYNLEEEKAYEMNPLFEIDAAQVINYSPLNADSSLRGKVIRNDGLFFDAQKKELYLFSRIESNGFYLSIIDAITMKEQKAINLSTIKIPFVADPYPYVHIDLKKNIIYIEDEYRKVRGYPLSLVLDLTFK